MLFNFQPLLFRDEACSGCHGWGASVKRRRTNARPATGPTRALTAARHTIQGPGPSPVPVRGDGPSTREPRRTSPPARPDFSPRLSNRVGVVRSTKERFDKGEVKSRLRAVEQ